jgi:hypothetical protein
MWYGIFWTLLNVSAGLFSWYAHKIAKLFGKSGTLTIIFVFIVSGYLLLGFIASFWAILIIFIFYFTRGIATPILKDYINKITTSDVRATVLSIRSFFIRIFYSFIGPLMGWLTVKENVKFALFTGGIFFTIIVGFILYFVLKYGIKKS